MTFSAAIAGFMLGAGLIIAIGAQNAFVLRQGIRHDHVLAVVAVCIACDWALIMLGALGFGSVIGRFPAVTAIAAWAGAAFLLVYGGLAFKSALRPGALSTEGDSAGSGPRAGSTTRTVVGATLAVSLLNPHVYLDTVVLIGSVAAQYAPQSRAFFALGAGAASAAWFATLGYGARLLAPLFARPAAWRVLDVIVGMVMWWIALSLVLGQVR